MILLTRVRKNATIHAEAAIYAAYNFQMTNRRVGETV